MADTFETSYFHMNTRTRLELPGVRCLAPERISDPFGTVELPDVLRRQDPDVVLACHDAAVLGHHARLIREQCPRTRIVLYLPLEHEAVCDETVDGLALADDLVCYTRTAHRWITERLRRHPPRAHRPRLSVLPHGVDPNVFGPLGSPGGDEAGTSPGRTSRARQLLGLPDDGPLILNANRDTPRKRLDVTLRACAAAFTRVPEARLVLTHGAGQHDRARALGLGDHLVVPDRPPADDATLNLYYNSAEVGLNTSSAEGWGLVSLEHAATGAAQIMPDHPALREIWGGSATFVRCAAGAVDGYGLSTAADHAAALVAVLTDAAFRDRSTHAARRTATSPSSTWASIAERWKGLLAEPG
ncbi:glycosyltransferase family 4 protein [Kitasatospora sp. NPDC051702]|uniref:glycosyltransferase family 4 protein n=1 Tax=Kitasatospora sp. NPDC051702 TaxID=3155672 RepID=UPI00341B111E